MVFRKKTRGCSRLPLEVYIVTSDLKLQLSYNITLDIKYTSQCSLVVASGYYEAKIHYIVT